jgi:hypothetical protein
VDDPALVAVREGVEDREGEARDPGAVGQALRRGGLRERLPLDEPQRVPEDSLRLAGVVDGGDVRVLEGSDELRLEEEPLGEVGVGDLAGPEDLQRLDPPEAAVSDLDDDRIAPLPEDIEELVALREERPGEREQVRGVLQAASGTGKLPESSGEFSRGSDPGPPNL